MYDVYSKFDIQKHKETFVNYLEVVIDVDGEIHYAVPSHQEFATSLACKKLNVSREELINMCPADYWLDYTTWLCSISNCVLVWDRNIMYTSINLKQISKLKILKLNGLYHGNIPKALEGQPSI